MKTKSKNIWVWLVSALSVCVAAVAWFFYRRKKQTTTENGGASSPISGGGENAEMIASKALGFRINNPLHLRYSTANNWKGQTGQQSGFCVFDTPENGIRAAMINLKSYRKIGVVTIADIISRWAPPAENDTENYIAFVCNKLRKNRNDEIKQTSEDFIALLKAMCIMEIGAQPYDASTWAFAAVGANL